MAEEFCLTCGESIPLNLLRSHVKKCKKSLRLVWIIRIISPQLEKYEGEDFNGSPGFRIKVPIHV